jgi:hypothetical protein
MFKWLVRYAERQRQAPDAHPAAPDAGSPQSGADGPAIDGGQQEAQQPAAGATNSWPLPAEQPPAVGCTLQSPHPRYKPASADALDALAAAAHSVLKSSTLLQVDEVWLTTVMAVTRICHEPNGHLRNHAALVLTGYAANLTWHASQAVSWSVHERVQDACRRYDRQSSRTT